MNKPTSVNTAIRPRRPGWHWSALESLPGLFYALELTVVIAVLDFITGYEVRLAMFYMLPIALATWTGGTRSGVFVSICAALCWFISFQSNNIYSRGIFYYWEGAILIATFTTFVLLIGRLRDAIMRADERFWRVLEGLHVGIYATDDSKGAVLYANPYLAQMFPRETRAPQTLHAVDLADRFKNIGVPTLEQAGFTANEARDEKTGRWYLIQSGPISWHDRERVSLKVILDISEQKQAQQLRRQHQEILDNAARSATLAEIGSTLAHEINQPLMAIASYSDACILLLSKQSYDTQAVIEALEKCRAQAVRAGQIIERMRDFLQRRTPNLVVCTIDDIIAEAVQSLELELQEVGIAVDLSLTEQLPIVCDRTLIMQAIINLLHNAIEAIQVQPGRIRLTSQRHTPETIRLSISDNGPGIPPEIADQLYTPFYTTKPQGLGLGLCICRSVIEAHGGRLWHETNVDGGTTFHFTLPNEQ